MSGPKVDVAELRRQEKERLAQARRRRLDSASGERLSDGGADQKWLPLTVNDFEIMGIFKEI